VFAAIASIWSETRHTPHRRLPSASRGILRRVKRVGIVLAVVVLAAAGAFGAIAFFNARDDAGVNTQQTGPGVPVAQLGPIANEAPKTQAGNVVLLYANRSQRPALDALANDVAGPATPALQAAGQAVIVQHASDAGGVVAIAGKRGLRVATPSDPQLRAFVEAWLGRASG
jgi:hypothetical protein